MCLCSFEGAGLDYKLATKVEESSVKLSRGLCRF